MLTTSFDLKCLTSLGKKFDKNDRFWDGRLTSLGTKFDNNIATRKTIQVRRVTRMLKREEQTPSNRIFLQSCRIKCSRFYAAENELNTFKSIYLLLIAKISREQIVCGSNLP